MCVYVCIHTHSVRERVKNKKANHTQTHTQRARVRKRKSHLICNATSRDRGRCARVKRAPATGSGTVRLPGHDTHIVTVFTLLYICDTIYIRHKYAQTYLVTNVTQLVVRKVEFSCYARLISCVWVDHLKGRHDTNTITHRKK